VWGGSEMRVNLSLSLLAKGAAPPLAFIVIGLVWSIWQGGVRAISSTLLSLGFAHLALLLLVVAVHSFARGSGLGDSMVLLLGGALLVYVATLGGLARHAAIPMRRTISCGVLGLLPLYFGSGFVLIYSTCAFGAGGC